MRNWMVTAILVLPFIGAASYAENGHYIEPFGESFGYSSEDWGGGSYLGVDTRDVTADRLGALNLKEEHGVEVTMVDQDAPAGKAGLKEHDVILTLNGTAVESVEQLRRMIHETPPGRVVTVGISRNGQPITVKLELADRRKAFANSFGNPKEFKWEMPAMPALPAMPEMDVPVSVVVVHSSGRSGLMVENLTPQLGDFFGTKNGKGVLVRSVEKGSRAEKAGFRAGDVIVKVNGDEINDAGDFSHALRSRKDNTASVGIIREKKEQTITLPLPERNQSSVFEESLDIPDIDTEAFADLADLQTELAEIQPQIELAVTDAQRRALEALRDSKDLQGKKALKQPLPKLNPKARHQLLDEGQQLRNEIRLELHGLDEI